MMHQYAPNWTNYEFMWCVMRPFGPGCGFYFNRVSMSMHTWISIYVRAEPKYRQSLSEQNKAATATSNNVCDQDFKWPFRAPAHQRASSSNRFKRIRGGTKQARTNISITCVQTGRLEQPIRAAICSHWTVPLAITAQELSSTPAAAEQLVKPCRAPPPAMEPAGADISKIFVYSHQEPLRNLERRNKRPLTRMSNISLCIDECLYQAADCYIVQYDSNALYTYIYTYIYIERERESIAELCPSLRHSNFLSYSLLRTHANPMAMLPCATRATRFMKLIKVPGRIWSKARGNLAPCKHMISISVSLSL